jgi:hypothetical protein
MKLYVMVTVFYMGRPVRRGINFMQQNMQEGFAEQSGTQYEIIGNAVQYEIIGNEYETIGNAV